MRTTVKIALLLGFFLFANVASAKEMRLDWETPTKKGDEVSYTVNVGEKSRKYSRHLKFGAKKLSVHVSELGLKTDAVNYVSATKKGEVVDSTELVILWTGDNPDSDEDGLSDLFEITLGTKPDKKDSDDDGIPDGEEYATWGPKRSFIDYDEDGLANLLDPDSDGDGIPDGEDSDIRRVDSFFGLSQDSIASGNDPFLHVYEKKKKRKKRTGIHTAHFKWNFQMYGEQVKVEGIRYRIYLKEATDKEFNFDFWEKETSGNTAVVGKLSLGVAYNFTIRVINSEGEMLNIARNITVTLPDWKNAVVSDSFEIFGRGMVMAKPTTPQQRKFLSVITKDPDGKEIRRRIIKPGKVSAPKPKTD